MEDNLILEGLLSMVTELKERQEKQVMPASREETINRLDVIEQRIRNEVNPALLKHGAGDSKPNRQYRKGQSENQNKTLKI